MGIDLTSLAGQTASISVEYMGQSADITYNPTQVTQENITYAQQGDKQFVEAFATIVKGWDVTLEGKKVPITEKGLTRVPLPFLKAVLSKVIRDGSGTGAVEAGKASSGGSRRTAKSGSARTGTRSSKPRSSSV